MNKNIVWSLLFVLAFIVGCDDENDPFYYFFFTQTG